MTKLLEQLLAAIERGIARGRDRYEQRMARRRMVTLLETARQMWAEDHPDEQEDESGE